MNASMKTLRKTMVIAMSVLGMGAASLTVQRPGSGRQRACRRHEDAT